MRIWRRGDVTTYLAWMERDPSHGDQLRTIVWVARDRAPDVNRSSFLTGLDVRAAANRIAAVSPDLPAKCPKDPNAATELLDRYLSIAAKLPTQRRAAALLAADFYQVCVQGARPERLAKLGFKAAVGCPQDGPNYGRTFREQAKTLDPHGEVGALAELSAIQSPCSLVGSKP